MDPTVDLHALVGWIPEHISIRDPTFASERTWNELCKAFHEGRVLLTLGTGKKVHNSDTFKLLPLHSYAIIHMQDDDTRTVTVVNPWRERNEGASPVWNLSYSTICSLFDSIPLAWNPAQFEYTIQHHRFWLRAESTQEDTALTINSHIRVMLSSTAEGTDPEIWFLLTRHVREDDGPPLYVSLHVFQEDGVGISFIRPEYLTVRGVYQEGVHYLTRFAPNRDSNSLFIIPSLYIPKDTNLDHDVGYTLTLYAHRPVAFDTSVTPPMETKKIQVEFTLKNSGGNYTYPTFLQNPQWRVKLGDQDKVNHQSGLGKSCKPTSVRFRVHGSAGKDLPLNIKLIRTSTDRLDEQFVGTQVVLDTGVYNYGMACGEATVPSGDYILVLSTYSPGQTGLSTLSVASSDGLIIEPVPAEGLGMHMKAEKGNWSGESAVGGPSFGNYANNPIFELTLPYSTDLKVRLRGTAVRQHALPLNITLFSKATGSSPLGDEALSSGPYSDSIYGVSTPRKRMGAGTYLLVPSTHSPGITGEFEITVWSERRVQLEGP